MPYGKELILDLHHCDESKFNRTELEKYFTDMCDLLDMEKCELFWWDDHGLPPEECQTEPHLKGTSAVQFIMTSNITIHTLDILKRVYLNIFSCKEFDAKEAEEFTSIWFSGDVISSTTVDRI